MVAHHPLSPRQILHRLPEMNVFPVQECNRAQKVTTQEKVLGTEVAMNDHLPLRARPEEVRRFRCLKLAGQFATCPQYSPWFKR